MGKEMLTIQVDDEIVLRVPIVDDAEAFYDVVNRNRDYLGECWILFRKLQALKSRGKS